MKRIDTKIMGVLNVTSDSFSDGGKYLNHDDAIKQGEKLIKDGADILDIGAVASSPQSEEISSEQELQRLIPLIEYFKKYTLVEISIDTFNPEVQKELLDCNIDYINDIQAFRFEELYPLFAKTKVKLIMMHSVQKNTIADHRYTKTDNLIESIINFFQDKKQKMIDAGIDTNQLIIDPGMGYFLGANPDASLLVLNNIKQFKTGTHLPILIAVSKKSFIQRIAAKPIAEISAANLATEIFALNQGIEIIRTHEVAQTKDAITILNALHECADLE